MKIKTLFLFLTLLALWSTAQVAQAQGTAFSYQGRLTDNGSPANNSYDLRFQLFSADVGGSQVGPTVTSNEWLVVNGLFTVTLDFGINAFDGNARWLETAVRPGPQSGAALYTPLIPRQQMTPAPYAIYAGKAAGLISGAGQTFTGPVTFDPANGQPPFSVGADNAVKVNNLNADLLDNLDSSAFVLKSGDTMNGNLALANPSTLDFGSTTRQMVNLYGITYGIGVQASTLYNRSHGGFAWHRDGVHSNTKNDPGAGGVQLMTLSESGDLSVDGGLFVNNSLSSHGMSRGIYGEATGGGVSLFRIGIFGYAGDAGGNTPGVTSSGVYGESSITGGNGVVGVANNGSSAHGIWGKSSSGYAGYFDGKVKVNGGSAAEGVRVDTTAAGSSGLYGESTGANANGVVGEANNGSFAFGIWGKSTSGYAGYFDGKVQVNGDYYGKGHLWLHAYQGDGNDGTAYVQARDNSGSSSIGMVLRTQKNGVVRNALTLDADGKTTVNVLTITGGADLAEPFEMSARDVPTGAVVVIDEDKPGHLKLSERAYDSHVAGIVSGANGVNAGITLHQEGLLEGGQNVALSGRVYVQADATKYPIKPGDLLTTSDVPGYAMKATDREKAQGAILGKAMTALERGKGTLLVLVTLQ